MARVLAVDDDPATLSLVEAALGVAGHEVLAFSDPYRALEVNTSREIDAAVLDLSMPGLSGWDLLQHLRAGFNTRNAAILLLSATGDTATRVRGLRAGADDFLVKPFAPEELVARLETVLSRRQAFAARLQGRLEEGSLAEVLQNLSYSRRCGDLEVHTPAGRGFASVRNGGLVVAEYQQWRGREALFALLEPTSGTFRLTEPEDFEETLTPATVMGSIDSFLLAAAWVEDELVARSALAPDLEAPLTFIGLGQDVPPEFAQLGVRELAEALARGQIESFDDWLRVTQWAPRRSWLALLWLIEQGAVSAAGITLSTPPAGGLGEASVPLQLSEIDRLMAQLEEAEDDDTRPVLPAANERQRLDEAVAAFFASAHQRGVQGSPLRITIWAEAQAREAMAPLIASVEAATAAEVAAGGSERGRRAGGPPTRRLERATGTLELRFLCGSGEWPSEPDPFAHAVALFAFWAAPSTRTDRAPILRRLTGRAPSGTLFALIGDQAHRERLGPTWLAVPKPPKTLLDLLALATPSASRP